MKFQKYASLIALMSLFFGAQAFAHAHLEKAEPAQNSIVHQSPAQVTLNFSEELETALSKIQVKDLSSGATVSTGKATDGGQGSSTLQISLKPLGKKYGKFEVKWRAVSKDTHKMQGSYTFKYDPAE